MKNVFVIHVGDFKEKWFSDAENEYIKRLRPFCGYKTVFLKEESTHGEESQKLVQRALEKEAEAIRNAIPKGAKSIALCIEGKQLDSVEFSAMLEESGEDLCFIIGSSHGLDEKLKKECDKRISMSKMTFPHRLARVMLAEQVYRGFCISNNKKYHK